MKRLPLHPKSPLLPLSHDKRDEKFRLGYVFQYPKLSEIPNTDWLFDTPLEVKDQGTSDMCTAFAATAVVEDHEGIPLDPGYSFAKEKQLLNDWQSYGGDLRTVAKAIVQFGALPKSKSPFVDRPRIFVADWHNWAATYDDFAAPQKQGSFFNLDGPYDYFDNIRAALWKFRDQKNSVLAGAYWYPQWSFPAVIPKTPSTAQPSGHAFKVRIGQKMINGEPYLVVRQSYGPNAGDNGDQYFPREVVNREWKDFGAFMFLDIDPNEVKQTRIGIIQQLVFLWTKLLYIVQDQTPAPVPPAPAPQPVPEPTPTPKYLWDKANARHSIRVICDEEGLSLFEKNVLCAVIEGESGFDTTIVHHNQDKRKTTDYGLCQFNDYWYRDLITPDEALHNPEKAVRLMIKQYRAGHLPDWNAYKSGSYKKFL